MNRISISKKINAAFAAMLIHASVVVHAAALVPPEDPADSFRVLCYHDVRDNLRDTLAQSPESTAVDSREIEDHGRRRLLRRHCGRRR